ncbi:MAG: Ig-like domain-containing protein [Fuerstiella sp.]
MYRRRSTLKTLLNCVSKQRMSRRKWRRNKTAGGPAVIELLESRLMLAAAAGDVDGDDDFDANDSFLIHLVNLAGTDAQIVQSKGNSPRTATQIRSGIQALQTNGDVDGDLDFDANDSFLIHLVELAGTDEQLEQSKGGSPLSVSAIRSNISQLKNVITEATVIASLSPASSEEMVSVTRETVVRFNNPVDPQTVTTDSFYLIANGERVPGRIRVSSTERFATFLYDEPLPAATEVRVVVNGDQIMDRDGVLLDADGDNQPGGVLRADFRTLPLTRIPGTNVFGFVKDSVTGEPIEGATIRVDAFPEANVVTDENGRFELVDMPAPEFFVHIDGSTSTSAAAGFVYPNVGKPFHSVPGQTVQLEMNREVFDIYLPPMAVSDAVGLSATQTTNVGFGAAGRAELQTMFPNIDPATWDRLQVSFGPGSAIDDQGNAATSAAVIPVPPDRIPGPLPPNLNPQLVVSIQAGGATSFDVPAPVTFPNLEGLAPGEKSLIFSFDHDAGRWVVVGTGTVSSDGLTIESDPGVGIVAPGWHLTQPGNNVDIPADPQDPEDDNCDEWGVARDLAAVGLTAAALAAGSALTPFGAGLVAAAGLGISAWEAVATGQLTVPSAVQVVDSTLGTIGGIFTQVKRDPIPIINPVTGAHKFTGALEGAPLTVGQRIGNFLQSTPGKLIGNGVAVVGGFFSALSLVDRVADCLGLSQVQALSIGSSSRETVSEFVDELLSAAHQGSVAVVRIIGDGLAQYLPTDRQLMVTSANGVLQLFENDGSLYTDPISGRSSFPIEELITDELFDSQTFRDEVRVAATNSMQNVVDLIRDGSERGSVLRSALDDIVESSDSVLLNNPASATGPSLIFRVSDAETGEEISRGRTSARSHVQFVGPADSLLRVQMFEPVFGTYGETIFSTGESGGLTNVMTAAMVADASSDTDGDGLGDLAEQVLGTNSSLADTDNDGISDGAEIAQGLDPLGGRAFPTGIIASLPLLGEANEVVLHSSPEEAGRQLAYLATGSHGIAIVDTSQFNDPIVLGQLELPGNVTDVAVDSSRQLAALAAGDAGLHIVNVSDPMQPALVQTLDVAASQVIIHDGLVYIAVDNEIRSYDLSTAELLERLAVSSARITGMAREGRLLVTMDNQNTLRTIELGSFGMVESGSVTLQHGGGRVFVGGGVAYAPASSYFRGGFATVDVRSPENPIILSESDVVSPFISPNTDVLPNGSGIGLLLGRAGVQRVLDVMDLSDLSNTDRFITRVALPAAPFSATMGSGLAYVADGTAGLQVINVLPFDNQRQPPVVTINSEALDIDTGTAGIQVQEGSTLSIRSDIQDDVQVRNVELLVDGQVVANDVSFPFDLTTVVATLSGQTSSIEVQLRATDTGGNVSVSNAANTLTLNIVPDTFAPEVVRVTPGVGSRRFAGHQSVRVLFSEPMAAASLTAASVQLVDVSAATTPIIPQQIQLRRDGHELQLIFEPLPIGDYQLTVQAASVTDRAGNAIGGADIVSQFSIIEDRDPGDTPATALDLGVLDAAITLSDRIGEDELGNADPGDVVAFRISQPRQISIDLTNRTDGSQLRLIADLNDNGIIDSGEVLRTAGTGGIGDQTIQQNLEPGRYFVQVLPWSNNDVTAYDLTLVAGTIILPTTPQDPGETLGTALDMGAISNTTIWFRDMYGVRDRNDFYRFSIDAPREIQIDLTGRLEGGEMRLIADLNDNGQIDSGEVLRTAGTSGSADRFIVQNLEAGTWFLQVRQWNNGNITPYDIAVTPGTIIIPTTPQDPGETLGTALDMGTLNSSGITYHDMVGVRDRNDFYQFSVDAPREVQVDLTGRLEGSEVRLIADLNDNGLIDSGEVLRTAGTSGSADRSIVQNLEAATYFLQVRQWNNVDITPYDITVTPGTILIPTTPQDPGETLGTALDMGALTTAAASFRDMYGVLDREDFYRFSIDAPREVQIDLTGRLEGGEVRLIADLNNDGDIDSGEVLRTAGTSGSADRSIVQNLEAGTWFLQVRQWSSLHISPYEISVTAGAVLTTTTPQDPGETLGTALDMGAIGSTAVSFRDMYGVHDREDFYQFSIDTSREIQIDLTGRLDGGEVRLIADQNSNGQIDFGEVLRTAGTSATGDRSIVENLAAGTYFLQIRQWGNTDITPYLITVTP